MNFSRKKTLIAGLLLIAVVNIVVLGGVAYNRSGEPDSTLRLSERELRMRYPWEGLRDSSGLALRLEWRTLQPEPKDVKQTASQYYSFQGTPAWLDATKMKSLGFDTSPPRDVEGGRRTAAGKSSREAMLVLEFNGVAYQTALARAIKYDLNNVTRPNENASDRATLLKREQGQNSRLFVIDAGLDAAALRAKYPDRSRFAILRGQVHVAWLREENANVLAGQVGDVSVAGLNVPLAMKSVFDGATSGTGDGGKFAVRYDVDVAVGKRLEPWITAAVRKFP